MIGGRKWKRTAMAAIAGLLLSGALAYAFIWGRLFPYSPIIVGFDRTELLNAVIYTQKGFDFGDPGWIDTLFSGIEEFHGLEFRSRPRVFFFGDEGMYARRSTSRARLCAFYGGSIVVSPWASRENEEGLISLEVYLTHELSHSLLYQHMGPITALRYPRWLLEGIATLGADQMGASFYPDSMETRALIGQGNWMPPGLFDAPGEDDILLDVEYRQPFAYCEFALIVGDLIGRFGRGCFQEYMTRLLDGGEHDAVFEEVFGTGFESYLSEFRSDLHPLSWIQVRPALNISCRPCAVLDPVPINTPILQPHEEARIPGRRHPG